VNIEAITTKINEFVVKYPVINDPLTKLHDKTKLDKAYIVIILALLPLFISFFFGWGEFIIDLIGFVYPVYGSIKAIEAKGEETQWLTYWLLFGLFKIVEQIGDAVISFIPFYYPAKVLFVVWCFYPSTKGATTVYNVLLKPYVVPLLIPSKGD